MDLKKVFSASKIPIAIVLGITLLYYALTFAIAPNLYSASASPGGAVSSLSGIGYVLLLSVIGVALSIPSLIATFWIGFNGAKKHKFGYEEAVAGGAMAGAANGFLTVLLTLALAAGIIAPFAGLGTANVLFSGTMLLMAAASGTAYALGGTIVAMMFSFFGCLVGRGFK